MSKETRQFKTTFEAREVKGADDTTESQIIGHPIVFDEEIDLGFCREVIAKGALDNADLTDVLFFIGHDTSKTPLARSRNNNKASTMQLKTTEDGLEVLATLDTENNSEARALYSAIARGDMTGMSFMFAVEEEEWEDMDSDSPLRTITAFASIFEVSAVAFPAYSTTDISVRDKETLDSVKRSLESARAASALESVPDSKSLELEKEKINVLGGL